MLEREFGVGEACWTSASRTDHEGFSIFDGDESEHADFTIADPAIADAFTEWLIARAPAATQWQEKKMVYHIEVKTTSGDATTPFDMSNNQYRLVCFPHPISS